VFLYTEAFSVLLDEVYIHPILCDLDLLGK